jgi:hypothetical protein
MIKQKIGTALLGSILLHVTTLNAVIFDVTDYEIDLQEKIYISEVKFCDAFQDALFNLLYNDKDSESLAALLSERYPEKNKKDIYAELDMLINDSESVLKLITANDEQAPHGELIKDNWIFRLQIKSFEHSFWGIIDRLAKTESYSYGFN